MAKISIYTANKIIEIDHAELADEGWQQMLQKLKTGGIGTFAMGNGAQLAINFAGVVAILWSED